MNEDHVLDWSLIKKLKYGTIGILLALFLIVPLVQKYFVDTVFNFFLGFVALTWLVLSLLIMFVRCPSCKESFFYRGIGAFIPFRTTCVHCRIQIGSQKPEYKEK